MDKWTHHHGHRFRKCWMALLVAAVLAATSAGLSSLSTTAVFAQTSLTMAITPFPIPTANSQPQGITAGPGGKLWFTEWFGNKVASITTTGKVKEYPLPTSGSQVSAITTGPDGNIWFGESGKVGKLNPSTGTIVEYTAPQGGNAFPAGITSGPDGNLWATDFNFNEVEKITTSGVFTVYHTPNSNSRPAGITSGPDGNLWFTETTGAIGRVTTSGVVHEFPIPTTSGYPNALTSGPGGLWFTEFTGNNVGKITTTGTVNEFAIPTSNAEPRGITTGKDGNVWFTESAKLGRITPTGTIAEANAPGFPDGITSGADGNLWTVEEGNDAVARVSYPTALVPLTYWAGYAASGSPYPNPSQPTTVLYSDVKASWTVPTGTCVSGQPTSSAAFWVGLGGSSAGNLEQIGILIYCDGTTGTLTYDPVYEIIISGMGSLQLIDQQYPADVINPNDKLSAEVKNVGAGQYVLSLTDKPASGTGWSFPPTGSPPLAGSSADSARNSADWIAEAPIPNGSMQPQPLDQFTKVTFTNCKANAKAISAGPTINRFLMTVDGTTTGTKKAVASTPLTSSGTQFTVTWMSSG